ncbi:MAG: hypothetical protein K2P81_07685 [Bacteriovoracaceae bacterium]|nr:hypothetical protein [Bacteriovoracaceae bacterium]
MNRLAWLVLGTLLAVFPLWLAKAGVVESEMTMTSAVPEDDVRQAIFRKSVEDLIKSEMRKMNLEVDAYDSAFNKKFETFYAQVEPRLKAELGPQQLTPDALVQKLTYEKNKSRFVFAGWDKLLKKYTIRKFAPHPDSVGVWQMTLEGEPDAKLLSVHVQRMLQEESKTFRKLYLLANVQPLNFSWTDLKLTKAEEFVSPIEAEWLKWFQENTPTDVEEVVICDQACRDLLDKWRLQDEKNMSSFVSPELIGSLLLTVNINLNREVSSGSLPETKMSYAGGLILQDLNTKQVLQYADLPSEIQNLRMGEQKQFNSAVASHCYRYPLGKFLEVKNQVGKSVSLSNSMLIRIINPTHLGQALRFIEWIRVKAAPMQAHGKLDSFKSGEARVLVFFRGEGNKFKSLVEAAKELESEWGRPLTVDTTGAEVVITVGNKP